MKQNPKNITLRVKLPSEEEPLVPSIRDASRAEEAWQHWDERRKAALRRQIRTLRQKLQREAKRKGCTPERRKEIKSELQDLKELERQECGSELPKRPSARRPSARELGFGSDTPSADEILEAAIIQRGLRQEKLHLILAKLAKKEPPRWKDVAEREAQQNPKIERTTERIEFGDIKEIEEAKCSKLDRVIAGNYFQSRTLKRPLRKLSAAKASEELVKLGVNISPDTFDRALRRLALVD